MSELQVTIGTYRTRDGGIVRIVGPHPRFPSLFVGEHWPEHPGAYWWCTGVHPHYDENDLIEEVKETL